MITLTEKLGEMEKKEIIDALGQSGWRKARAARLLGITERMIGYKIKKYGIKREVMAEDFVVRGAEINHQN